jgi:hypothetical protein
MFIYVLSRNVKQGCQTAYSQTKNPNLGKFWRVLQCKVLVYFMAISFIVLPFGIFCGNLVNFTVVWYIFSRFGVLFQDKSGNPDAKASCILCYQAQKNCLVQWWQDSRAITLSLADERKLASMANPFRRLLGICLFVLLLRDSLAV